MRGAHTAQDSRHATRANFQRPRLPPFNQQSNARHHPPRTQLNKHPILRMKAALFTVGCMPLLARPRPEKTEPLTTSDGIFTSKARTA